MFKVLGLPRRIAVFPVALALAAVCLGAAGVSAAVAAGEVYTLTNGAAGNAVKVFSRAGDGSLAAKGEFATGGTGTGTGLGNQGALALERRLLFAVNPGSDSISSFRVRAEQLELIDTDASGGDQPISLTADDGLLYVLNAGGRRKHQRSHVLPGRSAVAPRRIHKAAERRRRRVRRRCRSIRTASGSW